MQATSIWHGLAARREPPDKKPVTAGLPTSGPWPATVPRPACDGRSALAGTSASVGAGPALSSLLWGCTVLQVKRLRLAVCTVWLWRARLMLTRHRRVTPESVESLGEQA